MRELLPWLTAMRPYRGRLQLGIGLLALTLLAGIGLLALSGWFITATGVTAMLWAAGTRVAFDVYVPGGGIRFFAVTRTLARYTERVFNHNTVLTLLAALRVRHFSALTRLDGNNLARIRASQWLNRLTADIDTLDNLYLRLLAPPLVALLCVLVVSGLLAAVNVHLGLIALALLLLVLLLVTWGSAHLTHNLAAGRVWQLDQLRARCVEQLQGIAELAAAGHLAARQQQLLEQSQQLISEQLRWQQRVAVLQAINLTALLLISLLGLTLALQGYTQSIISGPAGIMIAMALLALHESFAGLPAGSAQWGATLAAAERLNQQTSLQSCLHQPEHPAALPVKGDLFWHSVSVRHAGLQSIDLHLPMATSLAVIGPSGCGKSSLAALAARLIDPDNGQVLFGSTPLTSLDLDQWRSQIGYLTQSTDLLHDSIASNLRLGSPDASDDELWQALDRVELGDMVRELPDGLHSWVGETGRQLSGGEGRRLALARVLLKDPPIVILDEPFTGVDHIRRERIKAWLHSWLQGRTVLLLAHDADALPAADRVLQWPQVWSR
ncbi:thiol reductant ABC exporter subunit CydC [Halopseudomonas salegens]|uniref:ATP-binding cassette, subfamily C, CydC n=1 Tax=Halopseudomonas salegens TaxID=1434072 RepID=A0A1H2HHV9_9GAMM|nr:thiol reductant ABC exporter subunit CydC [Halopseudomonas salegens]SDU31423.1 ATP-binding cassette, subfamily C, CydC [Halopseudomonas salegens]